MTRFRRLAPVLALSALLAVLAIGGSSVGVSAYGQADQPLAQITFSGNCDNPSFFACQPSFFGTGGFWAWVEIDSNGTADFTAAGCGHVVGGVGGAGGAGGGGFHGTAPWAPFSGSASALMSTFPGVFVPLGPGSTFPASGNWYVVPALGIAVPTSDGHYSWQPTNGVSLQVQVAP